jgi:hypothetical protein
VRVAGIICAAFAAGSFLALALCRANNRPTPVPPHRVGQAAARTDRAPHPSVPAANLASPRLTSPRRGARFDEVYAEAAIARFRQSIDASFATYDGPDRP